MINKDFWKNKKVLITGHTGFKGSWLSVILSTLKSEIFGLALPPENEQNLFTQLNLENFLNHNICDIRNLNNLEEILLNIEPDIVFHLAAQPLVRRSYKEPLNTWTTNLLGTINVLESIRKLKKKCTGIMITTDKVYENNEWDYGYRETDKLGGHDPYSTSKAACELAIDSWRKSFFLSKENYPNHLIASARAGNVIGGGDWSEDRIIPDIVKALNSKNTVKVRNPYSTRPWQHVLEPLYGYLKLAEMLDYKKEKLSTSYNFGPNITSIRNVKTLISEVFNSWPGSWELENKSNIYHEAGKLSLNIEKAYQDLNWYPKWSFEKSVSLTINWYKKFLLDKKDGFECCLSDIHEYNKTL